MTGPTKILTVSYGTFSCTLEGFDDPFDTMRGIAEYFRDLAADDRYFGAEPPTPDTEHLQDIARRDAQRRVEAHVGREGLVLRQMEDEGRGAPAPTRAPEPQQTTAPMAQPEPVAHTPAPEMFVDSPERALGGAMDLDTGMLTDASVAERLSRIRAVVQRSAPAETEAAAPDFTGPIAGAFADIEDDGAEEEDAPLEDILQAEDDTPSAEDESDMSASADQDIVYPNSPWPGENAGEHAEDEVRAEDEVEDTFQDFAANEPADAFDAQDDGEDADTAEEDTTYAQSGWSAPAAEPETGDAPQDEDEGDHAPLIAETPWMTSFEDAAEDDTETAEAAHGTPGASDGDLVEETDGGPDYATGSLDAPHYPEAHVASAAPDEALSDEDRDDAAEEAAEVAAGAEEDGAEAEPQDAEEPGEVLHTEVPIAQSTSLTPTPEELPAAQMSLQARIQQLKEAAQARREAEAAAAAEAERSGSEEVDSIFADTAEDEPGEAISDEDGGNILAQDDEDDFDLAAENDGDEQETTAPEHQSLLTPPPDTYTDEDGDADDADLSSMFERARADLAQPVAQDAEEDEAEDQPHQASDQVDEPSAHDAAMNRLLEQTNTRMDDTEGSRRRSAIAHLKAAVAATKADRLMKSREGVPDQTDRDQIAYRNVLANVVEATPAPVAMSSGSAGQTSYEADEDDQPLMLDPGHRVDPSEDDLAFTESYGEAPEDMTEFRAFAERMGATELPDLMEAAAAYTAFVEGNEEFSRPDLMRRVQYAESESYTREAGLRSFGMLLRQGKLKKMGPGQFSISAESRFHPQDRIAGQ